ncbi:LysM peptidoglycan-binding domain-containing protein [Paenibacillus sp. WLX1005]|uniref:LysM peptidoglycan-binding domain-containing protein n=1 Tax=Paenibacillus sp. WLX1005 TaxID=3243766 RepID=UPI003983F414
MLKYSTYKSIHQQEQESQTIEPIVKGTDTGSSHTTSASSNISASSISTSRSGNIRQNSAVRNPASPQEPAVTEWTYVSGENKRQSSGTRKSHRTFRQKTLELIQMTARKSLNSKKKRKRPSRKSNWNSTGRMFVCLLFASVLLYGGVQHFVVADESPAMKQHVIVSDGDSLWAIASQYKAPDADIRDYIAEIRDENNLATSEIQSGDVLVIPNQR